MPLSSYFESVTCVPRQKLIAAEIIIRTMTGAVQY